ncbi:sigma factor [Streptomyces sp. NPDC051913]|uniref:sigma factor n=1 Tax=Streptomyces sp. NPDC051913 TaxID=3365676 RepID=UPI0037D72A8F
MSDGSTASALSSAQTYARIYEEQQPRLVAYARSLTRNSWTAEDLVAEAHFRVWRRLAEGHEIDNVPAYLMTTVRHLASAAAGTAVRETPRDPHSDERVVPAQGTATQAPGGGDPAEQVSSVDLLVRVLGQLPERWVKALWLAEAEGQPLAAIGPQVGTEEGATAVLLHRAREGMRQAFLRVQTGAPDDPACQVHWARMPAYVRGAATERQSERLLGHVDACADCRARLAALMSANDRLPALVGPALLVFVAGGAGKYLLAGATAAGSVGAKGGVLEGVRQHATAGGSKAALAAGAVVAGAVVVILALGPGYSAPTPAERTPVAEAPAGQVPVVEGPVAEAPVAGPPVSGGGGGGSTTVQAASAQRGGGSSVVTRPQGGDDESTRAPSEPADNSAPPAADPAPQEPASPTEDTPEAPAPPPVQNTPEDPAPPTTEDTPPTAAPGAPAPDPTPAPDPVPDPTPATDPQPNPDPAPESPTPADPAPVENPAPADPPASIPTPATPPPTTTTPEPTEPPATADPAPDPTAPGDNCPGPEGSSSPAQD